MCIYHEAYWPYVERESERERERERERQGETDGETDRESAYDIFHRLWLV